MRKVRLEIVVMTFFLSWVIYFVMQLRIIGSTISNVHDKTEFILREDKRIQSPSLVEKKNAIDCGCPHLCDEISLSKSSTKISCRERIQFLMKRYHSLEEEACEAAGQSEPFQDTDEMKPCPIECNPQFCKDMVEKPILEIPVDDLPMPTFERYDGVVIATKVLWSNDKAMLKQMFCLLSAAYNRFVNYDLVVFTTLPWTVEEIEDLQMSVAPAKLKVVSEGPSLQEHIATMTEDEKSFLFHRCNVTKNEDITWFHRCHEEGSHLINNLGYSWQSEFRAYHIWTHAAIQEYKYMMWIDSDAMCTKTWKKDPIKMLIDNKLNLLFDHFPGGITRTPSIKTKMNEVYGKSICKISLTDEGSLEAEYCDESKSPSIRQVYGFFHVTRLDLYRNALHQAFLKKMVGDYKFSRQFDDQLAVTIPAVIEDGSKAWDLQQHGIHLGLHHNTYIDGKEKGKYFSYFNFWQNDGKKRWAAARNLCDGLVTKSWEH